MGSHTTRDMEICSISQSNINTGKKRYWLGHEAIERNVGIVREHLKVKISLETNVNLSE
jgi:hypothetical protein